MAQSRSGKKNTKSSGTKKRSGSAKGTSRSNAGRTASARSSAGHERQPSRRAQRRAQTPNLTRSVLLVGLGLLCVALVLVPGQNFWSTLRSWYFGIFGITTYLVGPFLLYLAYLLASGYRVALFAGKVSLMGVLCASVPVIFSKLNVESLKVGEIIKMLFTRGGTYFWEGGVLGAPIGATLLALFGRPASNIIMLLVLLLGVMFFFAITPADIVLFLDARYKAFQTRQQERAAAETAYDTRLFNAAPEEESVENLTGALPDSSPRPHHPVYDVIADTSRFPKQQAAPSRQPYTAPVTPVTPEAPFTAQSAAARPGFDVDLGPSSTESARRKAEANDPLEPVSIGPGGTFGMDPLRRAPIRATVTPIVPDAVDTAAEDFFTAQPEPTVTPTVAPAAPAEEPEQQPAPEPPLSFGIPLYDLTPTPEPAPQPVSAENAVAFRSEPDEDGWISITSDPVEEKDLNTLVAAAMEKPAVSEEQAANFYRM